MADFSNQFNTVNKNALKTFLQTGLVTPPQSGRSVSKQGNEFGLDDLLAFYFSTKFAQTASGLDDELRRFANVVDMATNGGRYIAPNDPTLEEAEGLVAVYVERIAPKAGALKATPTIVTKLFQPAVDAVVAVKGQPYLSAHIIHIALQSRSGDPVQGTDDSDLVLGASTNDILIGG